MLLVVNSCWSFFHEKAENVHTLQVPLPYIRRVHLLLLVRRAVTSVEPNSYAEPLATRVIYTGGYEIGDLKNQKLLLVLYVKFLDRWVQPTER